MSSSVLAPSRKEFQILRPRRISGNQAFNSRHASMCVMLTRRIQGMDWCASLVYEEVDDLTISEH